MVVLAGESVLTSDLVPPGHTRCRAYSSAGVAATANNALTLVPLGAESYDTATMHSTVTNTSRIVVPVAGCYHIIAQATWSANTTGRRAISVRKNAAGASGGGTQIIVGSWAATASSGPTYQCSDDLELAANDYVEFFTFQNISPSATLDVAAGETSTFMVVRLVDPT